MPGEINVFTPNIRGNGLTAMPAGRNIGDRVFVGGCVLEFIKYAPRSAVGASVGNVLGHVRNSLQNGSINGSASGNNLGAVTADVSESNSTQPFGVALNVFSSSAGSYRFGWALRKGDVRSFNRWLTRHGIASVQVRITSVGAQAGLVFNTDGAAKTIALTTMDKGRRFGVNVGAAVTSATSSANVIIGGYPLGA